METLDRIRRAVGNPRLLARGANRLYHRRFFTRPFNTEGIDVFGEDWDNLLILDACRYDMFEEQHYLPGTLRVRESRASHTSEFLKSNVDGRDLQDTVYVTSNPQLHIHSDEVSAQFHDVIQIWQDEGWHDDFKTVLPETVNEYAKEAAAKYPNKRLVVHYIQPHYPFIGSIGQEKFDLNTLAFWNKIVTGEISASDEDVWDAFRENLDVTLPYIEELMRDLPGKTVVTADHGQMIGERASPVPIREYGHPRGIYTDELVTVPWLEYENGDRKEIVAEERTRADDEMDDEVVEDRLQALGYK